MDQTSYRKFLFHLEEVFDLPPQTVGPLTPVYKKLVPLVKTMPWKIFVPLAFMVAFGLAYIFRAHAVWWVSLLQWGF